MSTNIFNAPNAMATTAIATLTNGGINSPHHHRHHSILDPNPASCILFPTTPIGNTSGTSLGGMSKTSPTTAFPFPPPSPGYLSGSSSSTTLNHHHHLQQQLSSWISPNPIQALALQMQPTTNGKLKSEYSTTSDNNNNDLISISEGKFFSSSESQVDLKTKSKESALKSTNNSSSTDVKDKRFSRIDSPGKNNNCSPTMSKSQKTVNNTTNCQQSNSDLTWHNSEYKPSSVSPFIMPNSYNSSGSPTSYPPPPPPPVGHLRPNQTSPSAFSYPPYLIPSIYSYYHQQPAATQSPGHQQQNSPISPFVVPNHHHLTSPTTKTISTNNNSVGTIFFHDSMFPNSDHLPTSSSSFDSSTRKSKADDSNESSADNPKENNYQHQKTKINMMQQIIDLTAPNRKCDDSPPVADQTKSNPSDSISVSLKRKSPDCPDKSPKNNAANNNAPANNSSTTSESSTSRKHRILKPPNINITECDFRNGFSSAFLPSPLYSLSNRVPASPYTYLDHIPLSAPPIPPSHHNSNGSNKCFEFPSDVNFPFEQSTTTTTTSNSIGSSSKEQINKTPLHLINNKFNRTNSTSILSKNEKKSDVQMKTAFQVPQAVGKIDNLNEKDKLNSDASKVASINTCNKKMNEFPEYFRKGSTIKLGDGNLKKIEELLTEDFIESASRNEKFRVELAEVISIKEKSKKGQIRIGFLVGQPRIKVSLDAPIDHPFFVYQKGWSSYSPTLTNKRYGLNCRRMSLGDIAVTLTNKQTWTKMRSLISSSSSLSSSSSTSLSNTMSYNGYPGPSNIAGRFPPPAHSTHNKQQSNNNNDNNHTVLNLDSKRRIHNESNSSDGHLYVAEDEDEIDVENIDDDDKDDHQEEQCQKDKQMQ